MNQDAFRALVELFPQLFTPPDLHAWLSTRVPDGDKVIAGLPGTGVAPAQFFFSAADTLRRYGLLGIAEFWDSLESVAPSPRKAQVRALGVRFGVPVAAPSPSRSPTITVPAAANAASSSPPVITVALVSACPETEARIQVDREFREIVSKLHSGRYRERFNLVQITAASFEELRTALLQHEPHILHISCHGGEDGSLWLEAVGGGVQRISKKRLLTLLTALADNLRLVLVNASNSSMLARDIPPAIDLAIGMEDALTDEDAIAFAVAFYAALAYGKSISTAFRVGLANLENGDDEVPQLFPPVDEDCENKRQMLLITH